MEVFPSAGAVELAAKLPHPVSSEGDRHVSALVLLVLGRIRVSSGRNRVLASDLSLPVVRDPFAAAEVLQDLGGASIGVALGVVPRGDSLGSRLLHNPLVAVADDMTLLLAHRRPSFVPNICSIVAEKAARASDLQRRHCGGGLSLEQCERRYRLAAKPVQSQMETVRLWTS
jgi:hypothetical protein